MWLVDCTGLALRLFIFRLAPVPHARSTLLIPPGDLLVVHGPSLPPPALRECGHRGLARCCVAVRWRAVLIMPGGQRHIHGEPTDAACTFMMRPTTAPSVSTSKSSSFHSPEGREAEARLRTR